jgi:Rnl2 family RNA ligase
MKFVKFPSLVNSYQEKVVINAQLLGIAQWTVTEKIHGANMGMYCDGKTVEIASRNNKVGPEFFKCGPVVDRYREDIIKLHGSLGKPDYFIVYGEYFGGTYEGKSLDQAKKVQRGVDYTPDNDFRAFNVLSFFGDKRVWTSTALLQQFLAEAKLQTVPILTTGSLTHCLEFQNDYNSEIPASYDLEPIEENVCEGNVIMPSAGVNYESANGVFRGFKNKNSKWSEKASKPKEVFNVSAELQATVDTLLEYATENRFQNVLSKEGEFDRKLIGKYIGLMLKDIYEDFLAEGNLLPDNKQARKFLNQTLSNAVRTIVLKHMG